MTSILESLERFLRKSLVRYSFIPCALLLYIVMVYRPSLQHALVGSDELIFLTGALGRNPFAGFRQVSPQFPFVYRPLFSVLAWTDYHLFGVNYAGYQLIELLLVTLEAVTIYAAVAIISRRRPIALLLALLFATSPFVSDLVNWPFDTATFTTIIAACVVILLAKPVYNFRWYGALTFLLLMAPFSRENGLAIIGAIVVYILYSLWRHLVTRQQFLIVCLMAAASVVIYFAARLGVSGLTYRPELFLEDTGILIWFVRSPELATLSAGQRIAVSLYNVIAQILSTFLPWLTPCGLISPETISIVITLLGFIAVGTGMYFLTDTSYRGAYEQDSGRGHAKTLALIALGLLAIVFSTFLSAGLNMQPDLLNLALALQSLLTLGIFVAVLPRTRRSVCSSALAIFVLALIVANSIVAFAYFRMRNLQVPTVGWLVFLVLGLNQLGNLRWERWLQTGLLLTIAVLIIVNGIRAHDALPVTILLPTPSNAVATLCERRVPITLAMEIARQNQIDTQLITLCRTGNVSPPIVHAPLPRWDQKHVVGYCGRTL